MDEKHPDLVHDLKCHPAPFAAIESGDKVHEIRDTSDRNFHKGDVLRLRLYDPTERAYVGANCFVSKPELALTIERRVTHITHGGEWGLPADLCVMSIAPMEGK